MNPGPLQSCLCLTAPLAYWTLRKSMPSALLCSGLVEALSVCTEKEPDLAEVPRHSPDDLSSNQATAKTHEKPYVVPPSETSPSECTKIAGPQNPSYASLVLGVRVTVNIIKQNQRSRNFRLCSRKFQIRNRAWFDQGTNLVFQLSLGLWPSVILDLFSGW